MFKCTNTVHMYRDKNLSEPKGAARLTLPTTQMDIITKKIWIWPKSVKVLKCVCACNHLSF